MRTHFLAAFALACWSTSSHAQTVFSEDFESGYANWTMTGLWNPQDASEACTSFALPFPSGTNAAWYGQPGTCDFAFGFGPDFLTHTQPIVLPSTSGVLELRFRYLGDAEDFEDLDARHAQVSADAGATWQSVVETFSAIPPWRTQVADLTPFAGSTILLRFQFHSSDGFGNTGFGWLVDDITIVERADSAIAHCLGDATGLDCPCGNQGATGRGCASSFNPAGARLGATGFASVSSDSLVFTADGMSEAAVTIVQSSSYSDYPSFSSAVGGDGRVCVRSPFTRIRTLPAPGGAATYPVLGDVPISIRGNVPAIGGTRFYSVRYRNAVSFCTPSPFNVTNGLIVTWRP